MLFMGNFEEDMQLVSPVSAPSLTLHILSPFSPSILSFSFSLSLLPFFPPSHSPSLSLPPSFSLGNEGLFHGGRRRGREGEGGSNEGRKKEERKGEVKGREEEGLGFAQIFQLCSLSTYTAS